MGGNLGTKNLFAKENQNAKHVHWFVFFPVAMIDKENKGEANNKQNSAAEKGDKQITAEREISEMKDSTSGLNKKSKENKKSKTCIILWRKLFLLSDYWNLIPNLMLVLFYFLS